MVGYSLLPLLDQLKDETNIAYKRSVNKQILDKVVAERPDTFNFVYVPQPQEKPAPATGNALGRVHRRFCI
jgi:dynein heavy chain